MNLSHLPSDVQRHSKLHSWYKHLPLEGTWFKVVRRPGLQPRNCLSPPQEMDALHYHLIPAESRQDGMFLLNCFWRGLDRFGEREAPRGAAIIRSRPGFELWKREHYPDTSLTHIFRLEHQRMFRLVLKTILAL